MLALGIDTATRNLGLALVRYTPGPTRGSGQFLLEWSDVVDARDGYEHCGDFITNRILCEAIEYAVTQYNPDVIGMESAALGMKFNAITVGSAHGAILDTLVRLHTKFVYIPPMSVKYFALGPTKGKEQRSKSCIVDAVNTAYGTKLLKKDHDKADAGVMATIAISAALAGFRPKGTIVTPWNKEWADTVLCSEKLNSRDKMRGILHRSNELFYLGWAKCG